MQPVEMMNQIHSGYNGNNAPERNAAVLSEPRSIELFMPEIKQLLEEKKFAELKSILNEINPIDLADGYDNFQPEQQLLLLKLLRPEKMIEVFEELEFHQQEYVVNHLEDQTLAPILEDIPPEMTAKLFKKLSGKMVKKMANLMKKERVEIVQDIMEYPPQTAGAIMHTDFLSVGPELTARAAIDVLQARARVRKGGALDSLFVTNGNGKLIGALSLRILIAAPSHIKIRDIMSPISLVKIPAAMDQEEAAKIFSRYKIILAPVVDEQNRLVGVLTVDDVIRVIQQEDTEDIQKLAGVQALGEPYFETSFSSMVKKRATWLCVLFLGEMLTTTAMAFFEDKIAKAVVLVLFIPLIISSGGNSGSQAATLIVRAIALKEISFKDWWRVIRREFASGLVLGSILGVIAFLRIYLWGQFSDVYGPHYALVALTVGLSLILVVLWGTVTGSILPIILRRIGLDPAVVSAPFVATLVDVIGLLIYFSIGLFVLRGTLL